MIFFGLVDILLFCCSVAPHAPLPRLLPRPSVVVLEATHPIPPQYLLALTIHDDIFATRLKDVEEVYRTEIPPHINDVKFEMKRTKLDLPIFRRPEFSLNGDRTPMMIGLLKCYSKPSAGYLNTFVFAGGHGDRLSSIQAIIPARSLTVTAPSRRRIRMDDDLLACSAFAAITGPLFLAPIASRAQHRWQVVMWKETRMWRLQNTGLMILSCIDT
jgi:hypothetical protein